MLIQVVIPRSPIQTKGLLLASIRDKNPTIFLEPKILYRSAVEYVPVDDYELPLGKAEILKPGKDITVVGWGSQIYALENAISMAEKQIPGLSVELIDLRTILPWDMETIAAVYTVDLVCQQDRPPCDCTRSPANRWFCRRNCSSNPRGMLSASRGSDSACMWLGHTVPAHL